MLPEAAKGIETLAADHVGGALARGVDPASPEAAQVVLPIVDAMRGGDPDTPELRRAIADRFALGTDRRVERYWQLLGIINGWPPFPAMTPAFEWTIEALRAHPNREG